jgi:hypothetical protein
VPCLHPPVLLLLHLLLLLLLLHHLLLLLTRCQAGERLLLTAFVNTLIEYYNKITTIINKLEQLSVPFIKSLNKLHYEMFKLNRIQKNNKCQINATLIILRKWLFTATHGCYYLLLQPE